MSNNVINITSQGLFRSLFSKQIITLSDHWARLPDKRLKVVARQIVLEDGTIIQLTDNSIIGD